MAILNNITDPPVTAEEKYFQKAAQRSAKIKNTDALRDPTSRGYKGQQRKNFILSNVLTAATLPTQGRFPTAEEANAVRHGKGLDKAKPFMDAASWGLVDAMTAKAGSKVLKKGESLLNRALGYRKRQRMDAEIKKAVSEIKPSFFDYTTNYEAWEKGIRTPENIKGDQYVKDWFSDDITKAKLDEGLNSFDLPSKRARSAMKTLQTRTAPRAPYWTENPRINGVKIGNDQPVRSTNMNLLTMTNPTLRGEEVARTTVHEATHVAANTYTISQDHRKMIQDAVLNEDQYISRIDNLMQSRGGSSLLTLQEAAVEYPAIARDWTKDWTKDLKYFGDEDEVYARVMEVRYAAELKPGEKLTMEGLEKALPKTSGNIRSLLAGEKSVLKEGKKGLLDLVNGLPAVTGAGVLLKNKDNE